MCFRNHWWKPTTADVISRGADKDEMTFDLKGLLTNDASALGFSLNNE